MVEVRSIRIDPAAASSELPMLPARLGLDRPDRAGRARLEAPAAEEMRSRARKIGTVGGDQTVIVRAGETGGVRVRSSPTPEDPASRTLEVMFRPEVMGAGLVRLDADIAVREAGSRAERALQDLGLPIGEFGHRERTPAVGAGTRRSSGCPAATAWLFQVRAKTTD